MVFHPPGIVVKIVGTEANDQGRSCEEHPVNCGEVLEQDVVVRLRKVQLMVEGREELAIAAIWVADGMDRCRVGFLPRHMAKHAAHYDGSLVQVTHVLCVDLTCCTRQISGCITKIGGAALQQSSHACLWLAGRRVKGRTTMKLERRRRRASMLFNCMN
jgi:hypothetical protein